VVGLRFAVEAQDLFQKGDVELNVFTRIFLTIGMAKSSTFSLMKLIDLRAFYKHGKDIVVVK